MEQTFVDSDSHKVIRRWTDSYSVWNGPKEKFYIHDDIDESSDSEYCKINSENHGAIGCADTLIGPNFVNVDRNNEARKPHFFYDSDEVVEEKEAPSKRELRLFQLGDDSDGDSDE